MGSGLGQDSMVPGTSGHEHLPSEHASTLRGSPVGQDPSPKLAQSTPPWVEMEWRQLTVFDLLPEKLDVIFVPGVFPQSPFTPGSGTNLWPGVEQTRQTPYKLSCWMPCLSLARKALQLVL